MIRSAIHRTVSGILLAYFVLFVVPPVSSFASNEQRSTTTEKAAFAHENRDRKQAARFLFDIIAWQQFKKTRQSEFLETVSNALFGSSALTGFMEDFQPAAFSKKMSLWLVDMGRHVITSHRSRSSFIRFFRSGSSPPVLFSR
jgi:hypothetical protein